MNIQSTNKYVPINTEDQSKKMIDDADASIRAFVPSTITNPNVKAQSNYSPTLTMPPTTIQTQVSQGRDTPPSYYSPIGEGLSLKNESGLAIGDYNYNKVDDTLFMGSLSSDTQNRMIGAVPKIASGARLKYAGPPTTTTSPSSTKSSGVGAQFGSAVGSAAGQEVGEQLQALENTAMNEYEDDMTKWLAQGKYWFAPEAELKPDLEAYLDQMPSAVESLKGSGMNAIQKGSTDTVGEGAYNVLLNPAALKTDNRAVSGLLNPLSLLDKSQGEGFAGYVGSQAAKGAMTGSAGGWIGSIVGAAVGVVKGIFTWGAAKREDKKNEQTTRIEFEAKLKEWTINKNKRLIASQKEEEAERQKAFTEMVISQKKDKSTTDLNKAKAAISKRKLMSAAIFTAGNKNREYRQKRLNKQVA